MMSLLGDVAALIGTGSGGTRNWMPVYVRCVALPTPGKDEGDPMAILNRAEQVMIMSHGSASPTRAV